MKPDGSCQNIVNQATLHEEKLSDAWRWQKRDVYLVDGTTLVLSDTPANQKTYPQTSALPDLSPIQFLNRHNLKQKLSA
jgi:hypothetical protein